MAPALGARLDARLGALPGARRLARRAARRSARRSAWRSARRLLGHPWWRSVREPAILDVSARICELATLYTEFVWLEEDRGRHVEVAPPAHIMPERGEHAFRSATITANEDVHGNKHDVQQAEELGKVHNESPTSISRIARFHEIFHEITVEIASPTPEFDGNALVASALWLLRNLLHLGNTVLGIHFQCTICKVAAEFVLWQP